MLGFPMYQSTLPYQAAYLTLRNKFQEVVHNYDRLPDYMSSDLVRGCQYRLGRLNTTLHFQ